MKAPLFLLLMACFVLNQLYGLAQIPTPLKTLKAYQKLLKPVRMSNLPYQVIAGDQVYNKDLVLLKQVFTKCKPYADKPLPILFAKVAQCFNGKKFDVSTLDRLITEKPFLYLERLDSRSLVENSLAIALCLKKGKPDLDGMMAELEQIRYRNGKCQGYLSRLHYFTDWSGQLAFNGLAKDVALSMHGIPYKQRICAMTDCVTNVDPDDAVALAIRKVEDSLSRHLGDYLSFPLAHKQVDSLQDGDIVGLTPHAIGNDVVEWGIIIKQEGKAYILNTNYDFGKVMLNYLDLGEVLWDRNKQIGGLKVIRLNP